MMKNCEYKENPIGIDVLKFKLSLIRLSEKEWIAKWITAVEPEGFKEIGPCPFFRKEFFVTEKIESARIYSTCLGLYELYLNGFKVSGDLFTPGCTSYNKRLLYQTYDVTKQLAVGKNVVGTILGNGWYKGNLFTFN